MASDEDRTHVSKTTNAQSTTGQSYNYSNVPIPVPQWYANGQPVGQPDQSSTNLLMHHHEVQQQQQFSHQQYHPSNQSMNQPLPTFLRQQVTYQQQMPLYTHHIPPNNLAHPPSVNQPIITSTPTPCIPNDQMAQTSKRPIDDVSRSLDTSANQQQNYQHQPPRSHGTRYFTPKKKQATGMEQGCNAVVNAVIIPSEVSSAACRFAATRYPFSPFLVSFKKVVKDKVVIDDLIKHANGLGTKLKVIAYRHKQVGNEYSLLVFMEDINSFCFLNDDAHWPTHLDSETFAVKKPSTPPQLCVVLPNVALNTDWEEFVESMKEQYQAVREVIRLKNRSQQPIRAVKVAFSSVEARNKVLEQNEMSLNHMKFRAVEYLSQAQVLICGNCCKIGHFQKNCPQGDKKTCKVCGASYTNVKEHECSGIPKCIHCGEEHKSTDSKCRIIKNYRAALTRNLLQQPSATAKGFININPSQSDFPPIASTYKQPMFTTTSLQLAEANLDTLISKKLDSFLAEIKIESQKTRETIDDMRAEMRTRDEESRKKIEVVEKELDQLAGEIKDYRTMINQILQNVCLIIGNNVPLSSKDKEYFMLEAKKLKTCSQSLQRQQ